MSVNDKGLVGYTPEEIPEQPPGKLKEKEEVIKLTVVEAIALAYARAMEEDGRLIIMGEDVAVKGGVFGATKGLFDRFGGERVRDTPLAERAIVGVANGIAFAGRPVVCEIQFGGFALSPLDPLNNHSSRMRGRTRGRITCPLVLSTLHGGGVGAPEHHEDCPEAFFAHVPGVRVVIPSSPRRAYGLLLAAIRDPDPVVFFCPTRIFRNVGIREPVSDNGVALPLDKCFVLREGKDVTLISWGAMHIEVKKAADILAEEGISAEVIDVATLKFIDEDTILSSFEKTGRAVIVHEAPRIGGIGAEIAAIIAEKGAFNMLAPIKRVTGYDIPPPPARLGKHYIPSVARIVHSVREVMKYK